MSEDLSQQQQLHYFVLSLLMQQQPITGTSIATSAIGASAVAEVSCLLAIEFIAATSLITTATIA